MTGSPTKDRALAAATMAHTEHHMNHSQFTTFAIEMHRQMQTMMAAMDAATTSGDPDRDFLAMMIPHHQGAVAMARLVLIHGHDPLVRQLADEIIASQRTEITSMTARLQILQRRGLSETDDFPAYSGMRGQ